MLFDQWVVALSLFMNVTQCVGIAFLSLYVMRNRPLSHQL